MKVLVTGAGGFVGGHAALALAAAGFEVHAAVRERAPAEEVRRAVRGVSRLDLSDPEAAAALLDRVRPEAILNAAAMARPDECERDPEGARRANVLAVRNLLDAAAALDPPPLFIQISTDLVFEGADAPPGGFREDAAPCPRSVYAESKAEAERFVLDHARRGVIMRVCLVYGRSIGAAAGFLDWTRQAFERAERLRLFSDEWRTPTHVSDISRAAEALLGRPELERWKVVHVPGAERVSRVELGHRVAEVFGYDPSLIDSALRPGPAARPFRARDVSLSGELLRREFGIEPLCVREGLEEIKNSRK